MSATLDVKGMLLLAREITSTNFAHAYVLKDIDALQRRIEIAKELVSQTTSSPHWTKMLLTMQNSLADLYARERQLLEHRDALLEQLRS